MTQTTPIWQTGHNRSNGKMEKTLGTLSTKEFQELIEHTIDKRLEVWLTQLADAWMKLPDEENAEFRPEFAASLKRSLEQAQKGEGVDLGTFRKRIAE
jgi:hypothetical protein